MLKWLGAASQSDEQEEVVEGPSRTLARFGGPEETGTARVRGASHKDSVSGPHESILDQQGIPDQPGSSGMESSVREHARQSRKRPLADPDGSDAEDASVPEPALPAPATFSGRRPRVPSRPSGIGSSARPPGKPASPEALPRSMEVPAQALPVRPSHRDAASAGPQRRADDTAGAAYVPERKPTLRQTYNTQADPEKHPKLSDNSSSGGSGHYDPTNQMILRLEYLTESDVKWAIFFIHVSEFVGLVVLVLYLAAKLRMDDNYFIRDNTLVIVNLCFGVLLWLALIEAFVIYMHHMVRTIRLRRQWSNRRYKSTVILMVETITQIINLCFFILPNAYVLARPCGWREPIVLWSNFVIFSCWNTLFLIFVVRVHNINLWLGKDGQPRGGRADATLVDAPWAAHAPKLLLWAAAEAFKATAIVVIIRKSALRPYYIPPETAGDCRTWLYECHHDSIVQLMLVLESVTLLLYLVLFLFYLARAFRQLSFRNVRDFRMGNQSARLILRTRLGAIIFFAACLIVFYYVRVGSCATWISSALGYLPMHIVLTANTMVMLWWFMPKDPDEQDQVLQAWLQEFAWTEAEKLQKWKTRAGNLRLTSAALHDLNKEPMFCFESAIKLYYYSHIIYHYHKLEGFQSAGGADEKKDEVTHIGMFRRQLARSFGHLRRSSVGPTSASAAEDRSQHDLSTDSTSSAGIYRDGSAQNLADGPLTDANLATGPNPSATAAKLKATSKASPGSSSRAGSAHGGKGAKRAWGQPRAEELSLDTALRLYGLERMEVLWERRLDTMALIAWGANRIVVVFRGTNSLKNVLADLEAWQTAFPPNQTGNHFWERPSVHNGFYRSYTANDFGKKIVRRVCELVSSHDWDWTKIYCTGHSLGGALALLAAYDISRAMEWVSKPTKVICYTFGAPRVGNHAFAHTYNKMVPETWSVVNDQDAVARRFKLCFLYKRPGQRVIINRRGDMLVRPTFIELTLNQTPFSSSVQDHFLLSYRDALAEICRAQMNRKKRVQGGLAGVLSLLEGDEFVRGILEPAGLTMDDLARPSIDSCRKLSVPPPPTDSAIPSKRAPSLGAPLPPPSPFQAAAPDPGKDTGIELQQQPSLDRSSSSSASSYKTAYAQSFVSSLSTDDVTAPGGLGLGSARPSSDTDISLAGIAHAKSGTLSDPAQYTGALESSVTGAANQRAGPTPDKPQHGDDTGIAGMESTGTAEAEAGSMQSSAKGDRSTAHRHLNGHGPHLNSRPSDAGMEYSLGLNEVLGSKGSFPGFWQNIRGEDAAAASLAAAAAAGTASFAARKDTPHVQAAEHSSFADTADSSMAAAEPPEGTAQAREPAPHMGSSAPDARGAGSTPSAAAEHKGEHDLMVATGYTGPSGLLRWRDGMSGQQAIEQLLKAQRTGGSVAPEVRIAAAYALANGAADAKRRRDAKLRALKNGQRQGPTAEAEPASSAGAGSEAAPATSNLPSSTAPGAASRMSTGDVNSGAQLSDMAAGDRPAADTGSPQRSAGALEPQPDTPHPYRVNPEFYRAGSGGSPTGRPGTVRFSDADAATAGVVDGDSAVPLPSSHRAAGSHPAAEELPETLETQTGSWLGWLPWSRATGSPRASDALSSAERGEHSGTGPAIPAPAAQTGTSGSPRADAFSAPVHSRTVQNKGVGNAEPGWSLQSTGAESALSQASKRSESAARADGGGAPGHTGDASNTGLSSTAQSKAALDAVSSSAVSQGEAASVRPVDSMAAQQAKTGLSSHQRSGAGSEDAAAGQSSQTGDSTGSSAQAGVYQAAAQRPALSTPSQKPSSTGARDTSSGPITPEKAEPPRKGAAAVEHDQPLPESAAAQSSAAAAVTTATGLEAAHHAATDAGSSQAVRESAGSPHSGVSYSSFYPEEPEESSSQGAWPIRYSSDDPLTAGEGSLSLWGREAAVQPRAGSDAAASLCQLAPDTAGGSLRPQAADADMASVHQHSAHGLEASSEQSMAPEPKKASMPGWRGAGPENSRGMKSEGEELFVAAPNTHSLDGAAPQQAEGATPFRFMGSESAPSTPTRSSRKRPGRRASLLAPASPSREGSQDLSIFSPSRNAQDAGSEEDISPRTRAMSRYLSGRLGSSALASPAQSRAATPEKPQAQAPLLETPSWAAQAPAAVADDSSPPRIRRKATPRELAEQFRGHGLKQAEWAPIPIYWAKDGSPAATLEMPSETR